MTIFIQYLFIDPWYFFMIALIVLFSVSLHEYFHAQVALWLGDSTAADAGHLTLNPLRQMGIFSLLTFIFIGLAWGAVPCDRSRLKYKWGDLAVSFAGPFANLMLFLLALILFTVCLGTLKDSEQTRALIKFIFTFGTYNFVLFVLNMIPAPGLDGWGVLNYFFPALGRVRSEVGKGLMVFLIFLAIFYLPYVYMFGKKLMYNGALMFLRLAGGGA